MLINFCARISNGNTWKFVNHCNIYIEQHQVMIQTIRLYTEWPQFPLHFIQMITNFLKRNIKEAKPVFYY